MQCFDAEKYVRPCPGFRVGGDTAVIQELEDGVFLAVVDVLGHGFEAHQLAVIIERFLLANASANVVKLMNDLHAHIQGSRGACAGLCFVETATGQVHYVGIGDTVCRRFGTESGHMASWDGIIGHHMRTPRAEYLWLERADVLLLYTDGVQDRFTLEDYPELFQDDCQTIAHTIVERFGRSYDDAGCIALRYRQ